MNNNNKFKPNNVRSLLPKKEVPFKEQPISDYEIDQMFKKASSKSLFLKATFVDGKIVDC